MTDLLFYDRHIHNLKMNTLELINISITIITLCASSSQNLAYQI